MSKHVIVISGAMGGIGQATSRLLAAEGHSVCVLYHSTDRSVVDAFVASLHNPTEQTALSCDITSAAAVAAAMTAIVTRYGRIDVCIHAAVSKLVRRRISQIMPNDFRQQFEVTTFGALNLFQAAVTEMKKTGGGQLIAITTAALEPGHAPTTMAGYVCAKHALRGILQEFYNDVSINDIRVNAVAPDFVVTPLHNDLPSAVVTILHEKSSTPVTTPEDVAAVLSFLVSDGARTISGHTYGIGGAVRSSL